MLTIWLARTRRRGRLRLSRLIRWFAEIGTDPDLAVYQAANLQRQVPLLYGLLLINSLAVAITHAQHRGARERAARMAK